MSRARDFADLAGSADAGGITGRNLIINGAMQVAQRATSVSSFTGSTAYRTVDRFKHTASSSGTFTLSQSSTAPEGFASSLKIDCTTADASPNYFLIETYLEGQDLQQLKKGTSNAESVTLSFHVRSSKTGTYQVNLRDSDNTRQIGATYTISSADTWEKKEITFAGDTTGAFTNDNASSLEIEWWIAAGSTFNTGAVPTSWEAQSQGDRAAGLTVNIGASTSDDFYITGIQLEVGEQATPFEHRSFGDELARCQRYFYRFTGDATYFYADYYSTDTFITKEGLPVEMRVAPTVTTGGTGGTGGTAFSYINLAATPSFGPVGTTAVTVFRGVASSARTYLQLASADAAYFVDASAEL
tara:strand:- start:481 stop:1551 length:1071 start_codon:yes stop_codon:yes gene_type:complete